MPFHIHPRLVAGSHPIGVLRACHVLLKNNACFPWILVVPETEVGMDDLHQLDEARYHAVMRTVRDVSSFVSRHFAVEKLNAACIGNVVRQMHIHIVGRSAEDPAWPGTVWASDAKRGYDELEVTRIRAAARATINFD